MKNFIRILCVLMVMLIALSTLVFSASAAEFRDYYEEPQLLWGDADLDGKVNVKDATTLQKYIAKLIELPENSIYYGDVNGSGDITISDATTIQKYVANLIDKFPAEESYGNYYECKADGVAIDVEFAADSFAVISLTVENDGYYDISATPSKGGEIYFEITNDTMPGAWFSETDGESSFAFADMDADVYEVYMYTMGIEDVEVSFKVSPSDFEPPFDFASVDEINAGDVIGVNAVVGELVYKVDMTKLSYEGDAYVIYTKDGNNAVTMKCYDSNFCVVGESFSDDNGDAWLYVYEDYINTEFYVVVSPEETEGDYTICCDTNLGMLKASADEATLDEVYVIKAEVYTEEIEDEIVEYAAAQAVFKFTPDASGYYSFNFKKSDFIGVMALIADFDSPDSAYIMLSEKEEGGRLFDVLHLEANRDYYIISMISLETAGDVEFYISTSDEEEYEQAQKDNFFDDATDDQEEITEIFAGDTVEVKIEASDEEFFTKPFMFTAVEDCTIVIFSEGSEDACIYISGEDGEELFLGDDITLIHSTLRDFAVIGTLEKGEKIYFNVGTYADESDSFSFKVVYESDYTPLA